MYIVYFRIRPDHQQLVSHASIRPSQHPLLSFLPFPHCTAKHSVLSSLAKEVAALTSSSSLTVLAAGEAAPGGCSVAIVDESTTLHMLLKGILDPQAEVLKLQKKVRVGGIPLLYSGGAQVGTTSGCSLHGCFGT